jgi:cobalt/nickel transport system permease protein
VKHLEAEQWSRQSGPLHGLDARAKLIAVLIALVFIGTARPWTPRHAGFYAILALLAALLSRLEWSGLARRLALILPFPVTFAVLSWISTGDGAGAAGLISRSLVSASFAVVLIGVTSVPSLLEGAARLGAPRILISVMRFLYRYLFVLFDQALRMRDAASCRGGFRWHAASGAAAALFASSEERAARIHRAMPARGFRGRDPALSLPAWRLADTVLVIGTPVALATARILWQL